MPAQNAPASVYRDKEGLGVWEHRGKVAAVGIGMSPTARRWDGIDLSTSVGAWALLAVQRCLEDAGVSPDQVDGVVTCPVGTGARWSAFGKPYFAPPYNSEDGLQGVSADWVVQNAGLKNVQFTMHGPVCMSNALCVASQAVGDGLTKTLLVVRGTGNLEGRYGQTGAAAEDTARGDAAFTSPYGPTGGAQYAWVFDEYCRKYGVNHDMMAPFVINQRRNGLMNPDGYYAQHRPEVLTTEDYLNGRWINKPMNIYDNDLPIQVAVAYLFTTPERARDMKQKPVYILNHATSRPKNRGAVFTLTDVEMANDSLARKLSEGSGVPTSEIDVMNPYDGFTLFNPWYLESLGWRGVRHGDALHFFAGDITVEGPNPYSSSGGNNGSGRTRWWMHTDSIQQLQGRAGQRQVRIKNGRPETALSGGPTPLGGDWTVWGTSPD